jgi:histidyl-tRNA synthetase
LKAPKGTFDVLPDQQAARERVAEAAQRILEGAGYRRIETPTFESTELFARGVGESTDIVQKEMYTFDDGGGRSLTLRPEGTAPVCRAYLEQGMHKLPQPVKLWYLSSFFRKERPQAGRFRQFWQIGAEAIGSDDPAVDAELVALLSTLLQDLGVEGTRLRLGSLGSPQTRVEYRELLQRFLREHEDELGADTRARIDTNPLRAFDAKDERTQRVMEGAPKLLDHLSTEDIEHFMAVREMLEAVDIDYEVDPTLVRGLDYYARTVFEFTSDALGAQSGVGGGGRYDGLIEQLGGPPTPGCGWAAGIERILLAANDARESQLPVDLFIGFESSAQRRTAFELSMDARRAGMSAQMELAGRSLKGQRKQADRVGARWLAMVGAGTTTLRDMESGQEAEVPPERVVAQAMRGFTTS